MLVTLAILALPLVLCNWCFVILSLPLVFGPNCEGNSWCGMYVNILLPFKYFIFILLFRLNSTWLFFLLFISALQIPPKKIPWVLPPPSPTIYLHHLPLISTLSITIFFHHGFHNQNTPPLPFPHPFERAPRRDRKKPHLMKTLTSSLSSLHNRDCQGSFPLPASTFFDGLPLTSKNLLLLCHSFHE